MNLLRLIQELGAPEAYPHPVRQLHTVQTHTSCVFLTGDLVYKIKKPVDFGFVDYGTLEQRHHYCTQEVALNQRLCPEVYLDVVPVVLHGDRLRVEPSVATTHSGEVVEWAVRMRQLPEADMLPARLAAGTVRAADVERIAAALAHFHRQCPRSSETDRFGSLEAVATNVRENLDQTEGRTGEVLPPQHLRSVRDYALDFLAACADLFDERVRGGWVRDGHGDLRAQNICLFAGLQDGVQIFDCIEFNDRFRYGDVAADLAYLTMDLDLAGRADLRLMLVERYAELTADEGLREVLPFYQCYRAWIRGKIALLAAAEGEIPPAEREAHRSMAAAAFDLARSYAVRRDAPRLIVMVGYSGSGKSVVARELARRLAAVLLATDKVRKELAGVDVTERLPTDQYLTDSRSAVYEALRRRASHYLRRGEQVILDGTFLDPAERRRVAEMVGDAGAELWTVECVAPEKEARKRLLERAAKGTDPSDAGVTVYEDQLRRYPVDTLRRELETELPPERGVRLNTAERDQDPARLARQVLQRLG